jgi:phosphomevalonate kinase
MTSASAPGKVVLSGEYAVLDGAPAICMAVDRRARATIVESPRQFHSVTAPGYSDIEGRFTSAGGAAEWLQGRDVYPLLDAAWNALAPEPRRGLSITLDTRQFFAAGGATKAGLGSSAAMTVAFVGAISAHLGLPEDVGGTAHDAHRSLQGGRGSGVDVACSIAGGLIEYRMPDRSVGAIALPEGLCWALLWSGVASSTAAKIRRLADAATRPSREALAAAAENMAGAWRSGDANTVLGEYPAYCDALQRFGVDHGLGIFDAGHDAVAEAAAEAGLVYKPCGAGGGDVGIVMGADASKVDAFADDAARFGFSPLDACFDANGLTTD